MTSSGLFGANQALYDAMHTPVKIILGGPSDIAYENGKRDYEAISPAGIPIIYFGKTIAVTEATCSGQRRLQAINLAWLNWQLKGDVGATGKGFLHGSTCEFCTDSGWDYMSANIE